MGMKRLKHTGMVKTTHGSKLGRHNASLEHRALLLEASVWIFGLRFPWEPKAESGRDLSVAD